MFSGSTITDRYDSLKWVLMILIHFIFTFAMFWNRKYWFISFVLPNFWLGVAYTTKSFVLISTINLPTSLMVPGSTFAEGYDSLKCVIFIYINSFPPFAMFWNLNNWRISLELLHFRLGVYHEIICFSLVNYLKTYLTLFYWHVLQECNLFTYQP